MYMYKNIIYIYIYHISKLSVNIKENRNLNENVLQCKKSHWTERLDSSPGLPWPEEPRDDMEDGTKNGLRFTSIYIVIYESIAGVGETGVWLRSDFQSGSRVLKRVF